MEDVRGGGSIWSTRLVQFLWGPRSGAWARGELKEGVGVGWGVGMGADSACSWRGGRTLRQLRGVGQQEREGIAGLGEGNPQSTT